MRRAITPLSWLFGAVFLYAGTLKAYDPSAFLADVRSFALLPDPYAAWVALALPWIEIFSGLAIITGVHRRGGLLLLNASLLVFMAAIGQAWWRGINIHCGCFGSQQGSSDYLELLGRDLVLLALGAWLMSQHRSPAITPDSAQPHSQAAPPSESHG
jgi:putative oxidoreductase